MHSIAKELDDPTIDDPSHYLRLKYYHLNTFLKAFVRHWRTDYLLSLKDHVAHNLLRTIICQMLGILSSENWLTSIPLTFS